MANEEVDVYDVVLDHLLENGYAETFEAAEKIMVNMSEDWRNEIIEASMTPVDIERIAQKAATGATGKKKAKTVKKISAGMRE